MPQGKDAGYVTGTNLIPYIFDHATTAHDPLPLSLMAHFSHHDESISTLNTIVAESILCLLELLIPFSGPSILDRNVASAILVGDSDSCGVPKYEGRTDSAPAASWLSALAPDKDEPASARLGGVGLYDILNSQDGRSHVSRTLVRQVNARFVG